MTADETEKKAHGGACDRRRSGMMCFNPKVIAGLAVAGVGIWALAPNAAVAALPFLIFLACPLSMWLMMRGMNRGHGAQTTGAQGQTTLQAPAAARSSLPELKARLAALDTEQEAIAGEICRQETAARSGEIAHEVPASPVPKTQAKAGER